MTALLIIGKIILILLLFAIALICAVLFLPINYKIDISKNGDIAVYSRISWLLKAFNITIAYKESELEYKLRIFGIDYNKIYNLIKAVLKKLKKKQKSGKDTKKHVNKDDVIETENIKSVENTENNLEKCSIETDDEKVSDRYNKHSKKSTKNKKNSFYKNTIDNFFKKFRELKQNLRKVILNLKQIKNKIPVFIEFIRSDEVSDIINIIKGHILDLLKKLKPSKLKSDIEIGTGNPCSTGEILGVLAILKAIYGSDINIIPNFDKKIFEGNIYIGGRISIITFLIIIIKFIKSDEWKCFNKKLADFKEEI